MLNELVPYLFAGTDDAEEAPTPVRVVVRGEVPWFVAADICRVLGLTNPSKALSALDDEEKCIVDLRGQADTLTNREGIRRNTLTDSDTGSVALVKHCLSHRSNHGDSLVGVYKTRRAATAAAQENNPELPRPRSPAGEGRLIGVSSLDLAGPSARTEPATSFGEAR